VAFDADTETTGMIIGDGKAMVEGYVTGKHIGEFAGIPATGKDIRVPICVSYDLENDQIKRARIYFEMPCH
jgi:predicted ester cyclase